jgi:phytoene dehydrogenase-like protein
MAEKLRWPGAHPMFLDISLDQLAFLRPTRRLAGHTVPGVDGLFTCGASTASVGGIAGAAARRLP